MDIEQIGKILAAKRNDFGSTYKVMKYTDLCTHHINIIENEPETITMKTIKKLTKFLTIKVLIDGKEIADYAEIGNFIFNQRKLNGLTLKDISEKIGTDQTGKKLLTLQAVRFIEHNSDKAKIINIIRILKALGHELIIL